MNSVRRFGSRLEPRKVRGAHGAYQAQTECFTTGF